jgi:hypothetical protein
MPEFVGWFVARVPLRKALSRAVAAADVLPKAVTHNVNVNAKAPAAITASRSTGVISGPSS